MNALHRDTACFGSDEQIDLNPQLGEYGELTRYDIGDKKVDAKSKERISNN